MFSCNFLRINPHYFAKNQQDTKRNKGLFFMQNFMELFMKCFTEQRPVIFGVWDLKTSFR